MNDKKRNLFILLILLLLLVVGVSYAYFEAVVHGTGNTNAEGSAHTANIQDLILSGTTEIVNTNMIPGESSTYSFTIENPNSFQVCFGIYFDNVVNTFVNTSDLEVSMKGTTGTFPSAGDTSTIISGFRAPANSTTSFTLTITYKDVAGKDQTGDIGASFSGIIKARATECTPLPSEATLALLQLLNSDLNVTPNTSGNPDFSKAAPSDTNGQTSGLFEAEDDYGTSYYFRGDIDYNYVKFGEWQTDYYNGTVDNNNEGFTSLSTCESAITTGSCTKYATAGDDMYWRIIRINGDGSIRMIYNGTSAYGKSDVESSSANFRSIGKSRFNIGCDNAYVGYMYGEAGASSYAAAHTNTNDSIIKTRLDSWYQLEMTSYTSYISDTLFCNDRSVASSDMFNYYNNHSYYNPNNQPNLYTANAYGTNKTVYAPNERLVSEFILSEGNKATLTCQQKNDAFTVNDTTYGNAALTYPVGLLTSDEANMAGGGSGSNTVYYIRSGQQYWTMSPYILQYCPTAAIVNDSGYCFASYSIGSNAYLNVRPVINLKATAITDGDGTASNPFVVN